MKRQVLSYTYSASGKTVTFSDIVSGQLRLDSILAVFNETTGALMYAPGGACVISGSAVTGSVATNVLTLSAVPAGTADTDKLTIYYDFPEGITKHVSTAETLVANTVPNTGSGRTLTPSGFVATEVEISNIDGAAIVYGTMDSSTPSTTNFLFVLPATPCNVVLPVNGAVTVKLISAGTPTVGYSIRGA